MSTATAEPLIRHVSDTARWVAAYRAWETKRPDALFHDEYAAMLAGERGEQIAAAMAAPGALGDGWPIIARTKVIDDLVIEAVIDGCDAVVNLAAGLDTRPYRLDLPESLTWIEADLPEIMDYKTRILENVHPRCRLERHPIDLSDIQGRTAWFEEVAGKVSRALVLTEGLVVYLEPNDVGQLAVALARCGWLDSWVLELASPGLLKRIRHGSGRHLDAAPMRFGPADGAAFFETRGWKLLEHHSLLKVAARYKRVPWTLRWLSKLGRVDPRAPGDRPWSAVLRLQRANEGQV